MLTLRTLASSHRRANTTIVQIRPQHLTTKRVSEMTVTLIVRLRVPGIERPVVMATDNGFWVHNILGCVRVRVAERRGGGRSRAAAIFKIIFPVWTNSFDSSPTFSLYIETRRCRICRVR